MITATHVCDRWALHRRAVAMAGSPRGDSFPYCGCNEYTANGASVYIDNYQVVGQSLSFQLHATSPTPNWAGCSQDIDKIEINTCEDAWHAHSDADARRSLRKDKDLPQPPDNLAHSTPRAVSICSLHADDTCRWSKVKAFMGSKQLRTPVFDGAASKYVEGAQVRSTAVQSLGCCPQQPGGGHHTHGSGLVRMSAGITKPLLPLDPTRLGD